MTTRTTMPSLFERLGGRDGIEGIVADLLVLHRANSVVGERFRNATKEIDELERLAVEFLCTGLSGVETYDGLPMAEAHAGMEITADEYLAVLDDILTALDMHGVGELEKAEVLFIAYGLKADILSS